MIASIPPLFAPVQGVRAWRPDACGQRSFDQRAVSQTSSFESERQIMGTPTIVARATLRCGRGTDGQGLYQAAILTHFHSTGRISTDDRDKQEGAVSLSDIPLRKNEDSLASPVEIEGMTGPDLSFNQPIPNEARDEAAAGPSPYPYPLRDPGPLPSDEDDEDDEEEEEEDDDFDA